MSDVVVDFYVDGRADPQLARLRATLQTAQQEIGSGTQFSELLDSIGALWLSRLRKTFIEGKAPDGTPWVESAAARRRAAAGLTAKKTLFDTGKLYHSIQLFRIGPSKRRIATDVTYAGKHQYGQDGMPVRVILSAEPAHVEDLIKTADLFADRILERIKNG
jgi:phage gpG-like protein